MLSTFFYIFALCSTGSHGAFVDYTPGNLNIIITAPHGGSEKPANISNRIHGCPDGAGGCVYNKDESCSNEDECEARTGTDSKTRDIAKRLADQLEILTGERPHLIINNVHRSKVDMNREIGLGAQNDPAAEAIWNSFHDYIRDAKDAIAFTGRRGILFDIHGQSHSHAYTELGVLLSKTKLRNGVFDIDRTSMYALGLSLTIDGVTGEDLFAGEFSFGEYIENEGYDAVPSQTKPAPASDESFYSWGYITETHGSKHDTTSAADACQIEMPNEERRPDLNLDYVDAVARAINNFYDKYYDI